MLAGRKCGATFYNLNRGHCLLLCGIFIPCNYYLHISLAAALVSFSHSKLYYSSSTRVLLSSAIWPSEYFDRSIDLSVEGNPWRAVPLTSREDLILKKLLARASRLYHILCIASTKALAAVILLKILHTIVGLGHELSELVH